KNVLDVYYENTLPNGAIINKTPTDSEDLLKWLVDKSRTAVTTGGGTSANLGEDASLYVGNPSHDFNIKLGDPAFKGLLAGTGDPTAVVNARKLKEKNGRLNTKLTPAIQERIIKSALKGVTSDFPGRRQQVLDKLTMPDPTVKDLTDALKTLYGAG